MKTAKKVLVTGLCAAMLVAGSVMGTMAYLTSTTDTVENTFTVGKVSITLDESKLAENKMDVLETRTDEGNNYKLFPSRTYTKDPIVHVTDESEDCIVFVKVENGLSGSVTQNDQSVSILTGDSIEKQITDNKWKALGGVGNDGVYYKISKKADADRDLEVFEDFTINKALDNEGLAAIGNKNIKVTAYAIQQDGFTSGTESENALAAWAALNA